MKVSKRLSHFHTFRTIRREDMGRIPIKFTSVEATWCARSMRLPALDDRKSPDEYGALALWLFDLPHAGVLTERYALCLIDLRDIKGVRPAWKAKPWNTHELLFVAVNPDTSAEQWERGEYGYLEPVNYVAQFRTVYPHAALWVCEQCAAAIVAGRFPVEPGGIHGAKRLFESNVAEWERQAVSIFDGRGPKKQPGDE